MFRLHFPKLAPNDQAEFQPDPEWAIKRTEYGTQYPEWMSRAANAHQRLAMKLRKAWPYHQGRIAAYFRAIADAANDVERMLRALEAYRTAGGKHAAAYQQNLQELTYKCYLLSSFALAHAQPVTERPDAKFVMWRKVALTTAGASFATAHLGYAIKLRRDAARNLADIEARTRTMNAGTAAASATPRRGVRA